GDVRGPGRQQPAGAPSCRSRPGVQSVAAPVSRCSRPCLPSVPALSVPAARPMANWCRSRSRLPSQESSMTDPIALLPLPQSVIWSESEQPWETTEPREGLSVGLSEDLDRTEYALAISSEGASLTPASEAALADGRNTCAQIVAGAGTPTPCVTIHDRRRLHLDVGRHVRSGEDVEAMIDAMALHRLNVLHLHLTDDQGWRVEIKGYPKLTEVGGWRKQTLIGHMSGNERGWEFDGTPHGGFYTQEELKGLVEYARQRGIMIVPEVDLPGHMQAAIAAYPQLGNFPDAPIEVRETWGISSDHVLGVSDEVFDFLRDVLTQVSEI